MRVTERLANLSIPTVIIIVIVLLLLRCALLGQIGPFFRKLFGGFGSQPQDQPGADVKPPDINPVAKSIAELAESLAVAMALVFLLIRPFIIQAFYIPSESMVPTLLKQDQILVNKFIYRFREPKLADIVVFKAPLDATPDVKEEIEVMANEKGLEGEERAKYIVGQSKRKEKDFIKRVIGVPGDVVRVSQGYVVVAGMRFDHRDLKSALSGFVAEKGFGKVKLVDDKVLVDGRILTNAEVAQALMGKADAKVTVVPGLVYINGKPLRESYTAEDSDFPYPMLGGIFPTPEKWIVKDKNGEPAVKVPEGKLLVMGDNRNESNDARFWGLLDRKRVLGKAMFIFWPINRIRILR